MKKRAFYLTALVLLFSINSFTQSISNADFEDWSYEQYFEEPEYFTTTNPYVVLAGIEPNVTKTTDAHSGNFAIRLETVEIPDDTIFGAAFIGEVGDNSIAGGLPFTQRPDSVTCYAKYNIQFGDTAFLAVLFKKFGAPLGICSLSFIGNQANYSYFSAPVYWFVPIISPDSLVAGITSSTIESSPSIGSTITFDDIEFVGTAAAFPNGGFEEWNEYGADEPDNWTTTNLLSVITSGPGVTKSTDSYSGSFAAQLQSGVSIYGDSVCLITNGKFGEEGPYGGVPVFEFPKMVSGYYKYTPVGPDTALAGFWLYHYDSGTGITETLQEVIIKLTPTDEYTYFELPALYYDEPVPDTMNFTFAPSNYDGAYIGLGSTLLIDDLEVTYQPFITEIESFRSNTIKVYPNPAYNIINFRIEDYFDQIPDITITDLNGKTVYQNSEVKEQGFSVDVSDLNSGIYFYNLQYGAKALNGKFIIE